MGLPYLASFWGDTQEVHNYYYRTMTTEERQNFKPITELEVGDTVTLAAPLIGWKETETYVIDSFDVRIPSEPTSILLVCLIPIWDGEAQQETKVIVSSNGVLASKVETPKPVSDLIVLEDTLVRLNDVHPHCFFEWKDATYIKLETVSHHESVFRSKVFARCKRFILDKDSSRVLNSLNFHADLIPVDEFVRIVQFIPCVKND